MPPILERLFHVRAAGSTPGREALGGVTTFLTLAYILAVNPVFLTAAGIPAPGAIVATALSAAFATLLMAFVANYPIALAPGMGMNAFFAYGICVGSGVPWQTALGMVFWAGVLFVVLTVTGARRVLVRAVPEVVKLAGAVGIGLFIAFIGLQHGGIVRADKNTMVALGNLSSPAALLTLFGLAVSLGLMAAGVQTALFWGLAATVAAGLFTGEVTMPASLVSAPSFALPGLQIDFLGALRLQYAPLILVLLFFALFDTLGTLMGLAHQAGLLKDGELPRIERALTADALGMVGGALFGTSPVTSYIESGSGVAVGARTGLASVVTGGLLLLSLCFTPLVGAISRPDAGGFTPLTAPALILVGTLMVRAVREIDWTDTTEAAPAFFTALLMPLTFNISHGLAAGIVVYALVKLAARRGREVHWLMYVLAVLFVLRYALLPA
ncbi:MAG TPA: NCS2 family permease [Thermoanaerobaculia bacterium]|jgi:AGZA family xanthine/uracil permease-like MFS transporter|nr:NCS2 family permease [Thermoanaerobaculia bacterium]